MKRRNFLLQGPLAATGLILLNQIPSFAREGVPEPGSGETDLYRLFRDPPNAYRPYVRWWWNGDKIKKEELSRELRLLKKAGIGGVEINPNRFPLDKDELHVPALTWLSPEWIDMLQYACTEAASLGMTCDLIVGSGWPFGAEYLQGEARSQVMVITARNLSGPLEYEVSLFDLFKEADPSITSPFPGRKMKMAAVKLVPSQLNGLDQVRDLSDQIGSGTIKFTVEPGDYVLYGLVKIEGFQEVINGAPGANGPVLNHYDQKAVRGYLDRMSDTIRHQIGPLSHRFRSLFTDSLELEGANWCGDMASEFKKRRGYDLVPYLPFILFQIGSMGNTYNYQYGARFGPELTDQLERIRYDFDLTCSELLRERFYDTFIAWCKENGVASRIQAYGRGYQPLEGSFGADIPECETWIQYGLGTEMSAAAPKKGRAYTVVNKFVSSAAHLKSKRLISCEELTNIYMVFNVTLEMAKLAGDQSIISGTTQPVFHGFGYSPPEAAFPGWVRYGTFLNERNPWWPYFHRFTGYKARLSALLQQGDMFADIALLAPTGDLWSRYGAQNDPFPTVIYPEYQTLVWESIHQNGSACDYVSEQVIRDASPDQGFLTYGPRRYHTLFLIEVTSLEPATAERLFQFVSGGGRVFCIAACPGKSLGWNGHEQKDREVQRWVEKMKGFPDRFVLLDLPGDGDFISWFGALQRTHGIKPYVTIDRPVSFVSQVRYVFAHATALFFINSNINEAYTLRITPDEEMTSGKHPWVWHPDSGARHRLEAESGTLTLDLGPAESRLIVFDRESQGPVWKPAPTKGQMTARLGKWEVSFRHLDGSVRHLTMKEPVDLRDLPEYEGFAGTVVYRTQLNIGEKNAGRYLNLGKVYGISEVSLNGKSLDTQWYGRRIYEIAGLVKTGDNVLEVRIVTVLGNYLKTLKDNPVGQYWTNEGRKIQPFQSMGLLGPVTIY